MKLILGFFLLMGVCKLEAQDIKELITAPIPDSLTADADAVCRLDEKEVEIFSPGKMIVRERHIYTILNDKANDQALYRTGYSNLSSIESVSGSLYNASGKEIRHFKKKDMSDYSADGQALVSDSRQKIYRFTYNIYPFTVSFEEEDEDHNMMGIPGWSPGNDSKMSLMLSRYRLIVPKDYKIRYKLVNADINPSIKEEKGKIIYTWEIRNRPVSIKEPFSIPSEAFHPFMLVGPSDFEVEGYSGNMSGWNDFGKFYAELQKGRDILPDDLKRKVHQLTDGIQDPRQKISVLYDYLQKNTHYVLISFGIGGWQPYDAAYVAKNKYGDCKALSNFMVSLLKEAGITAHAVIIYGGRQSRVFFADFPSQQFNHVICCVPLSKDTVWLECTDQYLPAGYLGSFTANRYGLLVNDAGGILVHTPVYAIKDNTQSANLTGVLDAEGNLKLTQVTRYQALRHDEKEELFHHYSPEQQRDYLKSSFELPTYSVNDFSYKPDYSGKLPVIVENLDLTVTNYAPVTGKRMFISPNVLNRSDVKLPEEKNRALDILFNSEWQEMDSVSLVLPPGYQVESQPRDIALATEFGKYEVRYKVTADRIYYFRRFERYSGRFSATHYNDLKNFYNSLYKEDHVQIVLIKKT